MSPIRNTEESLERPADRRNAFRLHDVSNGSANSWQQMHVMVAVEMSESETRVTSQRNLRGALVGDVPTSHATCKCANDEGRQAEKIASAINEARRGRQRPTDREREMQSHTQCIANSPCPTRRVGEGRHRYHHGRGRERAGGQSLDDTAVDAFRETEVVRVDDERWAVGVSRSGHVWR